MSNSDSAGSLRWMPHAVSGLGVILGLIVIGEWVAHMTFSGSLPDVFLTGIATSIPFIGSLIYGGYWIEQSGLSTDRYARIAQWWVAGIVGVTILVGVNLLMDSISVLRLIGTIRWSSAIGGSIGLIVGILQARAINQAIETERTQHRLQDTKRERDRLDEFASIVSHDLRNPLNVAQGRLQLAREECDSENLEQIDTALNRMNRIIDDVLWLSREGRDIGSTEPVEMRGAVESAWNLVADGVDSAELRYATDESPLPTFRADSDRLSQLLENLLRNALEHGGEGVTVTVGALDGGFYIEDDGAGIPDEERNSVFEAGYSTSETGTGFGLSIVKQVADAHGWNVRVTNGSNGGARFEITGVEFITD